jgi:hypothetical protein
VVIVLFFLGGILFSLWNRGSFLPSLLFSVGLTWLFYDYLGGKEDVRRMMGEGKLPGFMSFKIGGSIVTFFVSFFLFNHFISQAPSPLGSFDLRATGEKTVVYSPDKNTELGEISDDSINRFIQNLTATDFFHPTLITIRSPYCNPPHSVCSGVASFKLVATADSLVAKQNILQYCPPSRYGVGLKGDEIERSVDDMLVGEGGATTTLQIQRVLPQASQQNPQVRTLFGIKPEKIGSGRLLSRCEAMKSKLDPEQAIRLAAVMNPKTLKYLKEDQPSSAVVLQAFITNDESFRMGESEPVVNLPEE